MAQQIKKRGPTRGLSIQKAREMQGGQRLSVAFCPDFRQVVGTNAEMFNNECGIICRTACPPNYSDWRKVPATTKARLHQRLLINFDVDLSSDVVVGIINEQMNTSFKNYKASLHKHFLNCDGEEDLEKAKGLKPPDSTFSEEVWHSLCEYFSSDSYRVMSWRNSENRSKRKYVSLNGTVSTPNHHLRRGGTLTDHIGEIETFRSLHFNEKRGWTSDYAHTSYDNTVEMRQQADSDDSIEHSPSDLEIMQQVLGKRSAYIRGWSKVPSTRSDSATSRRNTGSSTRLCYSEMSSRLVTTESRLVATESELVATRHELANTRSELDQVRDDMNELRQMVRSLGSFPSFSFGSKTMQDQNLEDSSETQDLGMR